MLLYVSNVFIVWNIITTPSSPLCVYYPPIRIQNAHCWNSKSATPPTSTKQQEAQLPKTQITGKEKVKIPKSRVKRRRYSSAKRDQWRFWRPGARNSRTATFLLCSPPTFRKVAGEFPKYLTICENLYFQELIADPIVFIGIQLYTAFCQRDRALESFFWIMNPLARVMKYF